MNPPPPPPKSTDQNRLGRQKGLKWMTVIVGGLILVCILAVFVMANWPDEELGDESEMLPEWRGLGEDNPLGRFQVFLEENATDAGSDDRRLILRPGEWDAKIADEVIGDHAELVGAFRKLAAASDQPWEWKEGSGVANLANPTPYLDELFAAGKLALIASIRQAETGHSKEGSKIAMELIETGRGLRNAHGSTVHWLTGTTISALGLRAVENNAILNEFSEKESTEISKLLAASEADFEESRFFLTTEYLSFKRLLDAIASGEIDRPKAMISFGGRKGPLFLFQKNKTLNCFKTYLEPFVTEKNLDWVTLKALARAKYDEIHSKNERALTKLMDTNAIGNYYVRLASRPLDLNFSSVLELNARLRFARLCLALRRHQLAKGELPNSLDELIPEFMDEIPTDPFDDARSVRWDSDRQILYSVGWDVVDNGGAIDRRKRSEGADLGVEYWWKPGLER
ncbi:MAG: hypothetical protein KDM91_22710, partial [Verrucomicrobiae bacterium]|nr:hypothetical protein [Verrucomicrobiae bacterium]